MADDSDVLITITAADKASMVLAGVSKMLSGMTDAVSNLTKGYISYGDQVQKLSLFIGTNSEETSRLIQVADDAFIEFDTLRMAARNLADKGLKPDIETMANLADEFNRLPAGVERSQFLLDKFGRAGLEMAKLMGLGGDKIREMSASIEQSLIIDEKKAQKILESKRAVDGFNDAITGMKYEAAAKLLDVFQGMPKPLQDTVLALGAVGQSGLLDGMAQLSIIASNLAGPAGLSGIATAMKTFAGAAAAAAAPIVAVLALLYELYNIIRNIQAAMNGAKMPDQGGIIWQNGKPVINGAGGNLTPNLTAPSTGNIIGTGRGVGASNIVVHISPAVMLADQAEAETKLAPYIRAALRGA